MFQGADNCAPFDCQRLKEVDRCRGHVAGQLLQTLQEQCFQMSFLKSLFFSFPFQETSEFLAPQT